MISSARCEGYQIGFTITFSLLRTFHSCRYTALQHAGGVLAVTALNLLILCDELKPKVLDDCLEHGVVWLNAVHALDFGELMEQGPERDGLVEQEVAAKQHVQREFRALAISQARRPRPDPGTRTLTRCVFSGCRESRAANRGS